MKIFLTSGAAAGSSFFAEEAREETFLLFDGSGCGSFVFRVDGITYGAVGNAAELVNQTDGFLNVVDIVEGIEDTHDAQPAFDRVAAEAVDHVVGVRRVAEQVTAARKRRELRHLAHSLVDRLQARPRVLVEITHHRVGYGTAPDLHRIEICILVEGQATVYLCLRHARRERGLLSVAQRKVSDFEISCHCDKTLVPVSEICVIRITKVIKCYEYTTFSDTFFEKSHSGTAFRSAERSIGAKFRPKRLFGERKASETGPRGCSVQAAAVGRRGGSGRARWLAGVGMTVEVEPLEDMHAEDEHRQQQRPEDHPMQTRRARGR